MSATTEKDHAALREELDHLTTKATGQTSAETKRVKEIRGILGLDSAQAGNGGNGGRRRTPANDRDAEAGALGFEASGKKGKPVSQRPRAVEIKAIRKTLAKMVKDAIDDGRLPNATKDTPMHVIAPTVLGFKSETAMRRFVTGEVSSIKEVTADDGVAAREFHGKVKTHQLWLRKAIVGAFGVILQDKATA